MRGCLVARHDQIAADHVHPGTGALVEIADLGLAPEALLTPLQQTKNRRHDGHREQKRYHHFHQSESILGRKAASDPFHKAPPRFPGVGAPGPLSLPSRLWGISTTRSVFQGFALKGMG
jgi:hypothetical protein